MKALALLALLAGSLADAHYIFSLLAVNGTIEGKDYTYIRKNTNNYQPTFASEMNSPDFRCNKGAARNGRSAKTYQVPPGTELGFKLFYNEFIEHPGPGFVYMSKVPDGITIEEYDGSGGWFKVWEAGLCKGREARTDSNWCLWKKDRITFIVPQNTPPGDYLVRPEHIAVHEGHVGKAQFYMECAHIRVTGNGQGTPGPLVKIPGVYTTTDPGIAFNKWAQPPPRSYIIPGPKVWDGN